MVGTNSGAGAIVDYATCADDIVDGPVPLGCDHPSGSFFPFGTTLVRCFADRQSRQHVGRRDVHRQRRRHHAAGAEAAEGRHRVSRPASSGARVNYTVTATDNVDPNPKVKCTPPSGSLFPLGKTPVNCTATDASGNIEPGHVHRQGDRRRGAACCRRSRPTAAACSSGARPIPVKFTLVGREREHLRPGRDACSSRRSTRPGTSGPEKPAKSRRPGRATSSRSYRSSTSTTSSWTPVRWRSGAGSSGSTWVTASHTRPRSRCR